jgi:hypothetical protein
VVEKLLDLDLSLAGIAQGPGPGNIIKRRIVKRHPSRQAAPLTLVGGYCKDSGANGFRAGRHVLGVGYRAVIAFDLQDNVTFADHHGAKRPPVRSQQPMLEFLKFGGVHAAQTTNVRRGLKLAPAALRFGRREVIRRQVRKRLFSALGFVSGLGLNEMACGEQCYRNGEWKVFARIENPSQD